MQPTMVVQLPLERVMTDEDEEGIKFTLAMPEAFILEEIARPGTVRRDVAKTYALLLRDHADEVDWAKINHAIISAWSLHALGWIKEQAWSGRCWT